MKTPIKIFVAGPIKLEEPREMVKAIANEINTECQENGYEINVVVRTHTMNNHQDVFEEYIRNEADIVLFVLKDSLEGKTLDEYRCAASQYNLSSRQRPVFHVFLGQYGEKTSKIEDLENEMKSPDQVYYTLYTSKDDLRVKIKDEIENYVNKLIAKRVKADNAQFKEIISEKENEIITHNETINKLERVTANQRIKTILASILALVLIGYAIYRHFNPEPMLVFAGGGSVVNYIDSVENFNLRNYPHSVYINQASANAWILLVEDAYNKKKGYCPICLSADSLDDEYIRSKISDCKDQKRVIEIKIGKDPLAVYVDTCVAHKWGCKESISVERLRCEIIENGSDKYAIFATSLNSGTLRAYQRVLCKTDSINYSDTWLNNQKTFLYFNSSTSKDITSKLGSSKDYVILGSEYYYVTDLKKESVARLFLTENSDTLYKPIFIYFLASVGSENNIWVIDDRIIDFLSKIKAYNHISEENWKSIIKNNYIRNDTDAIVNLSRDVSLR